jgi:hypothetical protein
VNEGTASTLTFGEAGVAAAVAVVVVVVVL